MIQYKPDDEDTFEANEIDYLPARMVNEYVYCPRLFYLMHVEGQFADSVDTIDGRFVHRRVDAGNGALPEATATPLEPMHVLADMFGDTIPKADRDSITDQPDAPTPKKRRSKKKVQSETLFGNDDLAAEDDPDTDDAEESPENDSDSKVIHRRSVMLSSDQLGVIAKMDLIEAAGNQVTPVDYKRGRPRKNADGTAGAWPPERVQVALQALVLRDNGYECDSGVLYFSETRQRVTLPLDEDLIRQTRQAIAGARDVHDSRMIPPPLVDSPKCPKCSLVRICLPEETRVLSEIKPNAKADLPAARPMITARDERRPVYFNTQGMWVSKKSELLQAKCDGKLIQEVRLQEINQVNLFGNVQLSTQAIQTMCNMSVPVVYFSQKGYFYGVTHPLGVKNVLVRREQFRRSDDESFCLSLAKSLVRSKIRNCRTLLMRNHRQPSAVTLRELKRLADRSLKAESLASLLGIEGTAARYYFADFAGMLKVNCDLPPATGEALGETRPAFDFRGRNRRPPRDPVNAMLSLVYSLLTKDCVVAATTVGLDPHLGFYHQVKPGKPALALDLMEPFRPLIADSVVITAINNRMVTPDHFIVAGQSVVMSDLGRKHFLLAYEQRMDQLVTHPLFDYRVSYRRLLEIQTRFLARLLSGEIHDYPVFETR